MIIWTTAAVAADWVLMAVGDAGIMHVDRSSIHELPNGNKRAWFRMIAVADPEIERVLVLLEFDCRQARVRQVQMNLVLKNGGAEPDTQLLPWRFVPPGTSEETSLKFTCFGSVR